MTFKAWLMLQTKREDPVGDLARDVLEDRTWPRTQDTAKLRQYILLLSDSCVVRANHEACAYASSNSCP